jgi:hypothetical protein
MTRILKAIVALAALAVPANAEVTFPDVLQGQWCIPSSFKKAPGEPVPHTVCMGISSKEFGFNRAEGTVKRLTNVSANTWRVEFEDERDKWTTTWRLEGKRLAETRYVKGKKSTIVWVKIQDGKE